MIRFIFIGDQIAENEKNFAFWDTVNSKFVCFGDEQMDVVFDSKEGFIRSYESEYNLWHKRTLEELLSLIDNAIIYEKEPDSIDASG